MREAERCQASLGDPHPHAPASLAVALRRDPVRGFETFWDDGLSLDLEFGLASFYANVFTAPVCSSLSLYGVHGMLPQVLLPPHRREPFCDPSAGLPPLRPQVLQYTKLVKGDLEVVTGKRHSGRSGFL